MKNPITTRLNYVDIAKGLGMLAVIWGHIMVSGFSYLLVYAVDIPLFFFLSGMMYKKEKYSSLFQLVKSRAKTLLLPYVIFSFLSWIVWVAYSYLFNTGVESYTAPLIQTVIAQGSGGYLVHNVPLWFVTCLFVVEVVYYFICKTPRILNIIICIILAAISHFMLNNSLPFDFTRLPWNIEAAMSAMLFYSAGNLFTNRFGLNTLPEFAGNKKALSWVAVAVLTVIISLGALFNGHVSIGSNQLGNSTVAFYLIGFCGIISTLLFCALSEKIKLQLVKKIFDGIRLIGRNSFYFMALHVPIKGIVMVFVSKLFGISASAAGNDFLYSFISFVITVVIASVCVFIINRFLEIIKKPCI